MAEFILERFTYKPRYVQQRIWRTFGTVSALSAQFDIYISMFVKPNPTGRESALFSHGSASRKNLLAMDVR
jgi:hypothetical protein